MLFKNLLTISIFILSTQLYAQIIPNNALISTPLNQPSPNQQAMLNQLLQQPEYIAGRCVEVNLNILEDFNDFNIQFFEYDYNVNINRLDRRSKTNYSWFGESTENDGDIILTVLNNDVQGVIYKGNKNFKLLTLADLSKVIVEVDLNQLPEGDCINPNSILANPANSINAGKTTTTTTLKETAGLGCTMRALVMYTAAAEIELKNLNGPNTSMVNTIQAAIDVTNEAFIDSKIFDYENAVELVLAQKTDYVEGDSIEVDLYMFTLKDGELGINGTYAALDEVHTLREIYDADFCALITTREPGTCGQAAALKAAPNRAFFVMGQNCLSKGFTFAHELGHLLGSHHDKFVDTNTKYADGHGYVDVPNRQRTIMAYNNRCWLVPGGCPQIGYFSNPNVIEPIKNAPLGIVGEANNARVISLFSDTLFTFEQPQNQQIIEAALYTNAPYAAAVAKQNLSTEGNVTVQSNTTLLLNAKQSIELTEGFTAKKGSDVTLEIKEVDDCE